MTQRRNNTEIDELVRAEGNDAAAEERIVFILAQRHPPAEGDYISTDVWRGKIRRAQGRKRERRT